MGIIGILGEHTLVEHSFHSLVLYPPPLLAPGTQGLLLGGDLRGVEAADVIVHLLRNVALHEVRFFFGYVLRKPQRDVIDRVDSALPHHLHDKFEALESGMQSKVLLGQVAFSGELNTLVEVKRVKVRTLGEEEKSEVFVVHVVDGDVLANVLLVTLPVAPDEYKSHSLRGPPQDGDKLYLVFDNNREVTNPACPYHEGKEP